MFPRSQNLSDDDRRLPEPSRKFLSSGLSPKKARQIPSRGQRQFVHSVRKAPLTRSEGHSERLEMMFSSEQWLPLHKAV